MSAPKPALDLDVLGKIAAYHREHERFYTMNQLALASDLSRDANKLKVVADVWLQEPAAAASNSPVDYADPRYQAAGCDDLNALPAIAGIGILFMEGESEPAEIRALKAKLRGLGLALAATGQWLSDKMDAAWERESVLLAPDLIEAAWPRFQTIVTNWQGSRGMVLVGKLLALTTLCLDGIDFAPAAIRASRARSGRALRTAGWILDMAARELAVSGAALGGNDPRWTRYRDALAQRARGR